MTESGARPATNEGIQQYYHTKIDELQVRRNLGCALIRAVRPPAGSWGEDAEREETRGAEK